MDLCVPMLYCIYDAQSYLEAVSLQCWAIIYFLSHESDLDQLKTKWIYLVTAKCLNWINSASSSIAVMIHCCQSRDPLLQTHSANPFLSTGTCIKRIQFYFSVQVQFSSIRKLFLRKKIFCHLSFWLLKIISTIPFLAFVIRTFSLEWKSIFRGSN